MSTFPSPPGFFVQWAKAMRRILTFCVLALLVFGLSGCGPRTSSDQNTILVKPGQSLQDVIDKAPEHSVLVLSRGTWAGNLRVDKSLVLRGQGWEATLIQADQAGPPVLWVGKEAQVVVEGVTIKGGRGGYQSPEMSSSGVFATDGATLQIREAKIVQNAASGVFASAQANVILERVEIGENARYGVEVVGEAHVQLKNVQIVQNGMGGLWVAKKGTVDAEGSVVAQNQALGLWVRDEARVKLWDSEVRENRGPGMRCQDSSKIALLASRILKNDDVGVEVLGSAALEAYGTIFQENWHGILVRGGNADLQGCLFTLNRWDGINARGNSRVVLERTHLSQGRGSGISATEGASLVLKGCTIQDFRVAGVSRFSRLPVTGENNIFDGNGVALLGNVRPEIREKKATSALRALSFPHPDFPDLQSAIDALLPGGVLEIQPGSYVAGITVDKPLEIRGQGEVVLKGVSDTAPVLSLVAEAALNLVGVKITGGSEGLALGAGAAAEVFDCEIFENGSGIKLWQDAKLHAARVTVARHEQGGIWLWDESQAFLEDLKILENEMCGIGASGRSFLGLYRSTVAGNGWLGGVLLREFARAEIRENTFSENRGYGIVAENPSCVGSGRGFWGEVEGSGNIFSGNYKGPVCPGELSFLGR